MKPLVYIAAPYSGDLAKNIRTASRLFRDLFDGRLVTPYCPHWSVVGDLCCPMTYEQWMEHSIAMLQRCDAVLVMLEPSPGVKREMEAADSFGIPVFLAPAPMLAWAKEWTRQRQDDNRRPTIDQAEREIRSIMESTIKPTGCLVRICEGGGPENVWASLATSVSKLARLCESRKGKPPLADLDQRTDEERGLEKMPDEPPGRGYRVNDNPPPPSRPAPSNIVTSRPAL